MMDTIGVQNAMTDYANENGDQAMKLQMQIWLQNNMGGKWVVEPVNVNSSHQMERLETIVEVSEMIAELVANREKNEIDILSEIMRQLVIKFKEAKWDIIPQSK